MGQDQESKRAGSNTHHRTMMPRPLGTTFADLLGKLQMLRVECSKCGRFGRYPLHRLIDQHGGNGTILWSLCAFIARSDFLNDDGGLALQATSAQS
jgi:hypothetical protein